MRSVILLALATTLGCSEDPRFAVTTTGVSPNNEQVITQAFRALLKSCPALDKHRVDIIEAEARARSTASGDWAYVVRDYGWERWITVEITVSDSPSSIPRSWYAMGHHLFYELGAGPRPGIDVSKKVARRFCQGVSSDGFIAAPELAIVDRLR